MDAHDCAVIHFFLRDSWANEVTMSALDLAPVSSHGTQSSASIDRLQVVMSRTGHSRSTIYRLEAMGDFPKRVRLSSRSVGWLTDEITAYIASRPRVVSD
jgi:prophage regulatory protein